MTHVYDITAIPSIKRVLLVRQPHKHRHGFPYCKKIITAYVMCESNSLVLVHMCEGHRQSLQFNVKSHLFCSMVEQIIASQLIL